MRYITILLAFLVLMIASGCFSSEKGPVKFYKQALFEKENAHGQFEQSKPVFGLGDNARYAINGIGQFKKLKNGTSELRVDVGIYKKKEVVAENISRLDYLLLSKSKIFEQRFKLNEKLPERMYSLSIPLNTSEEGDYLIRIWVDDIIANNSYSNVNKDAYYKVTSYEDNGITVSEAALATESDRGSIEPTLNNQFLPGQKIVFFFLDAGPLQTDETGFFYPKINVEVRNSSGIIFENETELSENNSIVNPEGYVTTAIILTGEDFRGNLSPGQYTISMTLIDELTGANTTRTMNFSITRNFTRAANPGYKVYFEPTEDFELMKGVFEDSRIFDNAAENLNSKMDIPYKITIEVKECGVENAFYSPLVGKLYICYELLDQLKKLFNDEEDLDSYMDAMGYASVFILYHEAGHSAIHIFDLPITGKEEDVADQIATYFMLHQGEKGEKAAIKGAEWFAKNSGSSFLTGSPYWDTHSLSEQRFYNILCWVYGSNTTKYHYMVEDGNLPYQRAIGCEDESLKITTSLNKLLAPHIKEGGKMNTTIELSKL